jgi:hypothetical protein
MKKKKTNGSINISINSHMAALMFPLPDEKDAFDDARLGANMRMAMSEFYTHSLRSRCKHGDFDEKTSELLETIKEEFFACLREYDCRDVI